MKIHFDPVIYIEPQLLLNPRRETVQLPFFATDCTDFHR
jgi:hypothetical protein